ncbi:MAG: acyl-CoA dehydrogenase family protein [Opitutales bacterium]
MKTISESPTKKKRRQRPVIPLDKNVSKAKREAIELTEAARDAAPPGESFAGRLFLGQIDLSEVHPFPVQRSGDLDAGGAFMRSLRHLLDEYVDPDEIDRTGEIPEDILQRLASIGAFGIKIPKKYGGLGLSQTNYCRAATLLGSRCGNLTALLSAHQSIGAPQPLLQYGTEDQKTRYLPRLAGGEISAFALTEKEAGSDPARMETKATPVDGGKRFILNGEKLWCTNGTKAGLVVVMARTPDAEGDFSRKRITAFLVETSWPGVEIVRRCRFLGLRALYNGVLRFNDVVVPRENIIHAEGKGLKVALSTLNIGRLTLPAACVGLSKECLKFAREWASRREQWGAPIGRHEAIAHKLAGMAADLYAMEAMVSMTASLVDRGGVDVRIETAFCKTWATETAWRIVDDLLQIRGGRGYETAASLMARGEKPVPVERFLRDSRINRIFEGSSEIMRLMLAREALDPHLRLAGPLLDPKTSLQRKAKTGLRAGLFYAGWYPRLCSPLPAMLPAGLHPGSRAALRVAARSSRKLARKFVHAMARHGPSLERRQLLLGRLVDVGMDTFALSCAALRAESSLKTKKDNGSRNDLLALLDCVKGRAEVRIEKNFRALSRNADASENRLAKALLDDRYRDLEDIN